MLRQDEQPSLGCRCPGCGKEYGHFQVEISENRRTKTQLISQRKEPGLRSEKRENLKPIQLSWKNKIISEARVDVIKKSLAFAINILNSDSVAEEDKKRIKNTIEIVHQRMLKDIKHYELEDKRDSQWNVYDENGKALWNPVKLIKQYREEGDPLYHLSNMPILFFCRILKKYPLSTVYSQLEISHMMDGFKFAIKNFKSIDKQNWDYPLYEWLIIIEYEKSEGIAKTRRMLEDLDGSHGKKSRREIRNQARKLKNIPVQRLLKDFFELLDYLDRTAQNDPELSIGRNKRRQAAR